MTHLSLKKGTLFGMRLSQDKNESKIDSSMFKECDESVARNLMIGCITLKYTQSNSVCYGIYSIPSP